jgi:hypothetical protein
MSVLVKLNAARKAFHERKLKKTGHNAFAGYDYFELGDFLVPALQIFDDLKLSGVISFGTDLASMTLTDLEDGSQFVITSPMSTAKLKACHEEQNLGAVQTYLRRYLWVAALEIVEHDALNLTQGKGDVDDGFKAFDLASALQAVEDAQTVSDLNAVWAEWGQKAVKAGAKAGHAEIKQAAKERKAVITSGSPNA